MAWRGPKHPHFRQLHLSHPGTPHPRATREGEEEQRHGSCAVAVPSHTGDLGLAICWLRRELHPRLLHSGQVPCLLKQPRKRWPSTAAAICPLGKVPAAV